MKQDSNNTREVFSFNFCGSGFGVNKDSGVGSTELNRRHEIQRLLQIVKKTCQPESEAVCWATNCGLLMGGREINWAK